MHVDVLIVGAGLSGIGAAVHLQRECPGRTYAIVEGRERSGGTWDLFRYPGIRSDSDMYTLGYMFKPWTDPKAIADGDAILAYIRETAREHGIDRAIRYGERVVRAEWAGNRWTVQTTAQTYTCGFLYLCTGYYRYDAGYTPEFPGRERFRGQVVHPQLWTPDIDYAGKRVVVIGSGATAVTLVPELAKRAAHVTMLQRSPTYIIALPSRDPVADWLRARLPEATAYAITRWKNILLSLGFYTWCRQFPERAKRFLVGQVGKQLHGASDLANFTPAYKPWDQRLCLVPDSDLFLALRDGRASVVTDHIDTFTETGIRLRSGAELPADLIVTATGLQLQFFGNIEIVVDGRRVEAADSLVYKGTMLSEVPNLAFATGYTNASWTLKCDLSSLHMCRVVNHMTAHGYTRCTPRRGDTTATLPLLDFSSGYVQRAIDQLPRQGTVTPWRLHQNWLRDRVLFSRVDESALEWR